MKKYICKIISTLLLTAAFLLVSCGPSDTTGSTALDTSSDMASSDSTSFEQFIGTVADGTALPALKLTTVEGSVTLDTSDAIVYGTPTVGSDVEVLKNGDDVLFVAPANENQPSVKIDGVVIGVEGETLTLLTGTSTQNISIADADILSGIIPSVCDYVTITTLENGKTSQIEIVSHGGGRIDGTVTELTEHAIILRTVDDLLFAFSLDGVELPSEIVQGGNVSITYSGTLSGVNKIITAQIPDELPSGGTVVGTVTDLVSNIIMVRDDLGEYYSFSRAADNTFSNGRLSVGDSVSVDYSVTDGVLFANSMAQTSYTTEGLFKLSGVLTRFEPGVLSIRTENGNCFTLSHNEASGIFTSESPTIGNEVDVLIERNENDFLHCISICDKGDEPPTSSMSGTVTALDENLITLLSEGEETKFVRDGATVLSPLPIRRDDTITIEYIDLPSGNPIAVNVTFDSAPTPFAPTTLTFKTSGATVGEVISVGGLLCIEDDEGRVFAFSIEDAITPDAGLNIGDRLNVQYLGDPIQSATAVLITVAQP